MFQVVKTHQKVFFLTLLLLLIIPSILGLIHSGFPVTDDGNWMVIRFSAFYENLRNGQFPVRFLSRLNNGFGYPVADFLYPLFMYVGVPIHVLGASFVNTIKVILILSMISSSVFCFLWLRKHFDDISALTGSVIYTIFPYHLYDLYVRGSIGEILSLSIIPFVLWQIERKSFLFTTLGISFLILSHNTLSVLFLFLIIFYLGINFISCKTKKTFIYRYTSVLVISLGISSFFWIPAIYDLQYTVFSSTPVSDWSKYFSNVNLIGIPTLIILALVIVFTWLKKFTLEKNKLTILMLVVAVLSIFLSTSSSSFIWRYLPVTFIQFPFRFLSVSIVSISFLTASLVFVLRKKERIIVSILLIVSFYIFSAPYLLIKSFQYYPDSFYSTNQDTTTIRQEYMPKWVKKIPQFEEFKKITIINGDEEIHLSKIIKNNIEFNTYLTIDRKIRVNTVYFPGWEAYVNDKKTNIEYASDGFINLNLKKGSNEVSVVFRETTIRYFSDLISIISFISLFIIYYVFKRKKILL